MRVLLKGFDEFDKRMPTLGEVAVWAKPIMDRAIKYVHSQVPPAPPASGKPQKPKSRKQWFFVKMLYEEGKIPYRRTNSLARSLTTEVRAMTGNDIVGAIGTNRVEAPWVIGDKKLADGRGPQSAYHKGTWWVLADVVAKQRSKVREVFEQGIRALLS